MGLSLKLSVIVGALLNIDVDENMPSYDYSCKDCSENFTVNKSMNDTTVPNCPKCNSSNIRRIWGGFSLKGCGNSCSSGSSCSSCSGGSCSTCH